MTGEDDAMTFPMIQMNFFKNEMENSFCRRISYCTGLMTQAHQIFFMNIYFTNAKIAWLLKSEQLIFDHF